MNIKLLAYTQLNEELTEWINEGTALTMPSVKWGNTDGQAIALTAIRTCYSANKPSEIVAKEGDKYFGTKATDGEGTEADRLIRQIVRSKHLSTLEHISFTFAVEGVSRALLAQLTRHRVGFSFSVQSQRYVKFGSDDRSGGFEYVTPEKVANNPDADYIFEGVMEDLQSAYDKLRKVGVSAEDARAVLPNAATCNIVMTANLRALLDLYGKRRIGRGAQKEFTVLAEALRKAVTEAEPWTDAFFEGA